MSHSKISTDSVYHRIIQKVCEKMREEFLSEGVEEGTLEDIKNEWIKKLCDEGILEPNNSSLKFNHDKIFYNKKNFDVNNNININNNNNNNNNKDIYSEQLSNAQNLILNNNNFNLNLQQYNNNKSLNTPILNSQYLEDNKENILKKFDNISIQSNNNTNNNNTNNNNNNSTENLNQEIKTEEDDIYLKYFNENSHKFEEKEENNEQKENDEVLSELEDEADEEEDKDSKDYLLCQYEKVHRVKTKWKVTLNEVILHAKGKEYVYKKLNGDLERDW